MVLKFFFFLFVPMVWDLNLDQFFSPMRGPRNIRFSIQTPPRKMNENIQPLSLVGLSWPAPLGTVPPLVPTRFTPGSSLSEEVLRFEAYTGL